MDPVVLTLTQFIAVTPQQAYDAYVDDIDNTRWNSAGDGWTTPFARVDARVGGKFEVGYGSPDGSIDFTFEGTYTEIIEGQKVVYTIADGRPVTWEFLPEGEGTCVKVTMTCEDQHTPEQQREGWSAILTNFERYVTKKHNPDITFLEKSVFINAPRERVWQVLLDDATYREWTAVFCEGSYYELDGAWEFGKKIRFLSAEKGGLDSKIETCVPNYRVEFSHHGFVDPEGNVHNNASTEPWAGAREQYTLTDQDNGTLFSIYCEIPTSDIKFFDEPWDQALAKLKELSEKE